MRFLLILVLLLVGRASFAQAPLVTDENMTRARQGAGYTFPLAFELLPHTEVIPLGLSPDGAWVNIQHENQTAWIPLNALASPPKDLPPLPTEDAPELPTENCLSLVGDSVAYGTVVYVIPAQGFGVLRTQPLSHVLSETLAKRGLEHLEIRDHSASAAFLSAEGKFPYQDMPQYQDLLRDRCRFTLIMPWVNDMSIERANNAARHIEELGDFIQLLESVNPDGKILVLGVYYGKPSDFAAQHAAGFTNDNITQRNQILFEACTQNRQFERVICLPTDDLFPDSSHVVQGAKRDELETILYEPIPQAVQPLFEVFWRDNPNGEVFGDGVHLNEQGKMILSQALIYYLLALDPNL